MNQIVPAAGFQDSAGSAWIEPPTVVRRHRFDRHTLFKLWEEGFLGERRVELIDGEIYDMPPEGAYHQGLREDLTNELIISLHQLQRSDLRVSTNGPLRLGDHDEPEPDVYVSPRSIHLSKVGGPEAVLAVEVSVTTHRHDFGRKQGLYAKFGVRELWIIDGIAQVIIVHRGPLPDGSWREVIRFQADESVTAENIPGFAFRLADHLPHEAEDA